MLLLDSATVNDPAWTCRTRSTVSPPSSLPLFSITDRKGCSALKKGNLSKFSYSTPLLQRTFRKAKLTDEAVQREALVCLYLSQGLIKASSENAYV